MKMTIDTSMQSSSRSTDCLLSWPMSVNISCISFKNSLQFLRSSVTICFSSLTTIWWLRRSRCKMFINLRTSIRLSGHKTCFVFWISFPVMPVRVRILLCDRISLRCWWWAKSVFGVWPCTNRRTLRPCNWLLSLPTENRIHHHHLRQEWCARIHPTMEHMWKECTKQREHRNCIFTVRCSFRIYFHPFFPCAIKCGPSSAQRTLRAWTQQVLNEV